MGTVQTVLGPVEATSLGNVDAHEHIFLRTPVNPGEEFLDPDKAAAELADVARSGIDTVVDLTPIGLGRQPRQLADIAKAGTVHIVAATGYHRAAHYRDGHWAREVDDQVLHQVVLRELTEGVDGHDWDYPYPDPTPHRAGVIKLGSSYQRVSPIEARWFGAAAAAAVSTGTPIVVHTEVGTVAPTILDDLDRLGVPPTQVMLAHTDRNPDPDLHLELLGRGAFLVYDTIGRIKYRPDSQVLDLLDAIANAGRLDQVCLGTDVGRKGTLRAYGGGPGMDVLGREFIPRLHRRLGDDAVRAVLRTAPQMFLAKRQS